MEGVRAERCDYELSHGGRRRRLGAVGESRKHGCEHSPWGGEGLARVRIAEDDAGIAALPVAGAELTHGKAMLALDEDIALFSATADQEADSTNTEAMASIFMKFRESVDIWRESLRAKATLGLERGIVELATKDLSRVERAGESPESLVALSSLKSLVGKVQSEVIGRAALAQRLSELSADWIGKDKVNTLIRASTKQIASMDEVSELKAALDGVRYRLSGGDPLPQEALDGLRRARWYVLKRATVAVQEPAFIAESAEECITLVTDMNKLHPSLAETDARASAWLTGPRTSIATSRKSMQEGYFQAVSLKLFEEMPAVLDASAEPDEVRAQC